MIIASYRKAEGTWDDNLEDPSLFDALNVGGTKAIIYTIGIFLSVLFGIIVISFLYKCILSNYHRITNKRKKENKGEEEEDDGNRCIFVLEMLYNVIINWQMLYNVANFALAICGCIIHPFFFVYHLFVAAFRSEKLQAILGAITGPAISIILALILYIVMEYVFAVLGYVIFPQDFPDYTCTTLVRCFLFAIDQSYKSDGGLGAALYAAYEQHDDTEDVDINFVRIIYDFMFTLILILVIMQLLSGLIIDKFKSLRSEAESREKDLMSSCIICSESAEIIERKTKESFVTHSETIHNVWIYLMFIGYLARKPKLDFNGIESYVHENFVEGNLCWLPYSLYIVK